MTSNLPIWSEQSEISMLSTATTALIGVGGTRDRRRRLWMVNSVQ